MLHNIKVETDNAVYKAALEKMRARQPLSASFSEAQLNSAHENENFHVYSVK